MTANDATGHDRPRIVEKGRIEAFSDGVIAVAITLLVLDLRVPQPNGTVGLGRGLVEMWPNYVAYVISFLAIGIIWINHHTMLRRLVGVDHSVLVLNLLLLLRSAVAPPGYLLAGALGLVTPYLTLAMCVALGIFYLLAPTSRNRHA